MDEHKGLTARFEVNLSKLRSLIFPPTRLVRGEWFTDTTEADREREELEARLKPEPAPVLEPPRFPAWLTAAANASSFGNWRVPSEEDNASPLIAQNAAVPMLSFSLLDQLLEQIEKDSTQPTTVYMTPVIADRLRRALARRALPWPPRRKLRKCQMRRIIRRRQAQAARKALIAAQKARRSEAYYQRDWQCTGTLAVTKEDLDLFPDRDDRFEQELRDASTTMLLEPIRRDLDTLWQDVERRLHGRDAE